MDALDEAGHPEVAHGVLELLAVDVTFELLGVLLDAGSPVVFDLVVRPSRQVLRDFRPTARTHACVIIYTYITITIYIEF